MTDPAAFKSGREFAAWNGLAPRQSGAGAKNHLGGISKQGDGYSRRLLILGATAVIRYARSKSEKAAWINNLLGRRPAQVVTVAVADKPALPARDLVRMKVELPRQLS